MVNKVKNVSAVKWYPRETWRGCIHCPLCDHKMIYPKNDERKPALIFLDIDGVLIELVRPDEVDDEIRATLKRLFPDAQGHYTGYQQNIVTAQELFSG